MNYFIILYAFNFYHKSYLSKDSFNKYFELSLNLQRNILEKSITEAAPVKINPKPDFSPAPSILYSILHFPLMSLFIIGFKRGSGRCY